MREKVRRGRSPRPARETRALPSRRLTTHEHALPRPALRRPNAVEAQRLHGRRNHRAWSRHRCEHRDLQPRQRRAPASAAVPEADRIVYFEGNNPSEGITDSNISFLDFQDWTIAAPRFPAPRSSGRAALRSLSRPGADAERVPRVGVSHHFFEVLGVATDARPHFPRRRKCAGRSAGGYPERKPLETPLRFRSVSSAKRSRLTRGLSRLSASYPGGLRVSREHTSLVAGGRKCRRRAARQPLRIPRLRA